MDFEPSAGGPRSPFEDDVGGGGGGERPKVLPADLPTSLDDRRMPREPVPETEMYDGWQGQSQFLTSPVVAKPLKFSDLSLDDKNYDEDLTRGVSDSDTRLMEMLAAQAAHSSGPGFEDEAAIAANEELSEDEKKKMLQKALNMAASNGNVTQVNRILAGKAKEYVDINAPDEDGTPPLIYASCLAMKLS